MRRITKRGLKLSIHSFTILTAIELLSIQNNYFEIYQVNVMLTFVNILLYVVIIFSTFCSLKYIYEFSILKAFNDAYGAFLKKHDISIYKMGFEEICSILTQIQCDSFFSPLSDKIQAREIIMLLSKNKQILIQK